ncbi:hypothetical protein FB45DRAFT_1006247 [Roridomyces roridus]|uniref:Uncharacterized protein n=1 Tax=Roridomyces roridus TaxID=1738132 RepID=A0AAD7BII6_9AGAR|nr:hypothetical protein FB45DRAFT_1006247 [Roridomyces roridus]
MPGSQHIGIATASSGYLLSQIPMSDVPPEFPLPGSEMRLRRLLRALHPGESPPECHFEFPSPTSVVPLWESWKQVLFIGACISSIPRCRITRSLPIYASSPRPRTRSGEPSISSINSEPTHAIKGFTQDEYSAKCRPETSRRHRQEISKESPPKDGTLSAVRVVGNCEASICAIVWSGINTFTNGGVQWSRREYDDRGQRSDRNVPWVFRSFHGDIAERDLGIMFTHRILTGTGRSRGPASGSQLSPGSVVWVAS